MNGVNNELDHFELPQTFLKLPLVSNISEQPHQDYSLPIHGQIHSRKFMLLIKWLKEPRDQDWREIVQEVFDSNVILNDLMNLKFHQFLDFLIHTCYANESINWNSISLLENYLQKKLNHISRWNLPSMDFSEDLRTFFSTRIEYQFNDETKELIRDLYDVIRAKFDEEQCDQILPPRELTRLLKGEYTNMEQLLVTLGNIKTLQKTGLVKFEEFKLLISKILQYCKSEVLQQMANSHHQVLLMVFVILIFNQDEPNAIKICQDLLNKGTLELRNIDQGSIASYQWLIDAARGMVTNQLMKYKMEMVTEDLLLRSISERFLFPENTELQKWMLAIQTTELPLEIGIILIQGYIAVEKVLHRYYTQLPTSDNSYLITINNFLNSILSTFETEFVENPQVELPYYLEFLFFESMVRIDYTQLIITPTQLYSSTNQLRQKIEKSRFCEYFQINVIIMEMMQKKYPVHKKLKEIFDNAKIEAMLVGNEVFAKYFVNIFATCFNFAQQSQINGMSPSVDIYKALIYFLIEWMTELIRYREDLVEEILMMFVSFIRVITNMILYYYNEKGRIKTAEIWEMNYVLFELNLFQIYQYPPIYNIKVKLQRENIIDDFKKLIKEFGMAKMVNILDSKHFAIDSLFDIASLNLNLSEASLTPEKLQNQNIMLYLDLRNELEEFLIELETTPVNQLKQIFEKTKFRARNPPLSILDILDPGRLLKGVTYPYIQPINVYATAIEFFNLELELPEFVPENAKE